LFTLLTILLIFIGKESKNRDKDKEYMT